MAQQYALSELTLENKLVDERQKSAQLHNRIASQVEKTNQLQQRNDEGGGTVWYFFSMAFLRYGI